MEERDPSVAARARDGQRADFRARARGARAVDGARTGGVYPPRYGRAKDGTTPVWPPVDLTIGLRARLARRARREASSRAAGSPLQAGERRTLADGSNLLQSWPRARVDDVEGASSGIAEVFDYVCVDHRRLDVGVAKVFLDLPDVDAVEQ